MGIKDGMIQAARFVRDSVKICPGEAARRIREKREDERIFKARMDEVFDIPYPHPAINLPGYTVFGAEEGSVHPAALEEIGNAILKQDADLIYSDEFIIHNSVIAVTDAKASTAVAWQPLPESKIRTAAQQFIINSTLPKNHEGEHYFKPDYGPDSLRGCNYIGPFFVCRNELLKEAGAENYAELDEDGKWDAVIRLAEKARKVYHIPKVLFFRETHSISLRRVKDPIEGEPLVSILIPNKDHREDLKRCVDSIREKSTYGNWEIVVVENNSTEQETFEYYEELKKDGRIRVVSREGAFNYSAVNNLGAGEAKGEYFLLLNNDTEVISPDWIQEMLMFAQRQDVGAVGAKLYYPDGTIQHAGIGIGIKMLAGHWFRGFPGDSDGYYGRLKYAQDVSAVTGACMMIPRRVYEEMNGLDESFSVVFNDVDLCLRIRKAGYLIVWTPWAELTHYESKSRGPDEDTPEKRKFFVRETNRFLRRWWKALDAGDPYYNVNLTRWMEDFTLRQAQW